MNRLISLFFAAACLVSTTGQARSGETVVLVADEWAPFSGNALPNQGIAVDVSRMALERAGYDAKIEILPWARIVEGAGNGDHDAVTSLFPDIDMERSMVYSDPLLVTEIRFLGQKGVDYTISDLESLKPYSIAVGAGFLYEPAFDAADDLQKFEVTTALQAMRMVAAGRMDLTLDSEHVLRHAMDIADPALKDHVEILDVALTEQSIHMAVSRKRPDHQKIISDFNEALAGMQADGSLDTLLAGHGILLTE